LDQNKLNETGYCSGNAWYLHSVATGISENSQTLWANTAAKF